MNYLLGSCASNLMNRSFLASKTECCCPREKAWFGPGLPLRDAPPKFELEDAHSQLVCGLIGLEDARLRYVFGGLLGYAPW